MPKTSSLGFAGFIHVYRNDCDMSDHTKRLNNGLQGGRVPTLPPQLLNRIWIGRRALAKRSY
jgi:hypothetical protein